MKLPLFLLTALLGVVLALHLAMNGRVGSAMDNARMANALFWVIGAATALVVGFTGWESQALQGLKEVNPILFTAGALGALLVFAIAWLIPRAGAGPVFIILLTGQVIGALVLSHFGWLGSPQEPITGLKVVGALVMLAGAAIATLVPTT